MSGTTVPIVVCEDKARQHMNWTIPLACRYREEERMLKSSLLVVALVFACAAGIAEASRAPTYLEKISLMDAFNIPGRSLASRCVRIVVSTADPRWAIVTSPVHPLRACVDAGEVGDGFALYRRPGPAAIHWRRVVEGSGNVPCQPPPPVRLDLFGSAKCG
jgi:hypothetical protein